MRFFFVPNQTGKQLLNKKQFEEYRIKFAFSDPIMNAVQAAQAELANSTSNTNNNNNTNNINNNLNNNNNVNSSGDLAFGGVIGQPSVTLTIRLIMQGKVSPVIVSCSIPTGNRILNSTASISIHSSNLLFNINKNFTFFSLWLIHFLCITNRKLEV